MPDTKDLQYSLTGAQTGIWFAQQLDPDNPIYNTAEYIEINGPVNIALFEEASFAARDQGSGIAACPLR